MARPRRKRVKTGHLRCSKCLVEHPKTDEFFIPSSRYRSGYRSVCRPCGRELNKARYLKEGRKRFGSGRLVPKGTRVCKTCGEDKAVEEYSFKANNKEGLNLHCRDCCAKAMEARRSLPDYQPPSFEEARAKSLWRLYKITPEDYDKIWEAQGRVCWVCERGRREGEKFFAVDHSHITHEVRGILCPFCNYRFIGNVEDPALFLRGAEYLTNPPARAVLERNKP